MCVPTGRISDCRRTCKLPHLWIEPWTFRLWGVSALRSTCVSCNKGQLVTWRLLVQAPLLTRICRRCSWWCSAVHRQHTLCLSHNNKQSITQSSHVGVYLQLFYCCDWFSVEHGDVCSGVFARYSQFPVVWVLMMRIWFQTSVLLSVFHDGCPVLRIRFLSNAGRPICWGCRWVRVDFIVV